MAFTLITGASSGIGEEFARRYAQKGHSLILVARSEDKLNQLAQELRQQHTIEVQVIKQDLSQLDSAEQLFATCQRMGLQINLLINDAGIGLIGPFEKQDITKMQEMLLINIMTLTKLVYLFLPQLKQNQGALLNVASQAAFEPIPYMAAYGATKSYVLNLTEALRVELQDSNVRVMALCPGPTYTDFFVRANSTPDQIRFKFRTPQEVVTDAIAGLESNKAITIPGWENQVMTFMTRFTPRSLLAKTSQFMVKQKD